MSGVDDLRCSIFLYVDNNMYFAISGNMFVDIPRIVESLVIQSFLNVQ